MLCLNLSIVESIETKIVHNIQNEIITNIDIKNEFKYLLALNNSLKELDKKTILTISNESIIREKIKKIEILKNYKELRINKEYLDILMKNIYSKLGFKSLSEFEIYLKNYDINFSDVTTKVTIDAMWNELIIKKYGRQVTIDKDLIKKKILQNDKIQSKKYLLSEIIFEVENKEEIKIKYDKILKSINEIGFENTASLYSFSESSKIGGDIGWVNENSLNSQIKENIHNLKIEEISKPITLSSGILILKIKNIESSEIKINFESEFKKAIDYERNRQFNQYSKIYFKKIRKNLGFNE